MPALTEISAMSVSVTRPFENAGTAQVKNGVDFDSRSQHLSQLDIYCRSSECRNSNVGQQIMGNDNSVTGFSDHSANKPTNLAAGMTAGAALR